MSAITKFRGLVKARTGSDLESIPEPTETSDDALAESIAVGAVAVRNADADADADVDADAGASAAVPADERAEPEVAPVARLVGPRRPLDSLQTARDLEDAAMAYTEVTQMLDTLTRTTQAGKRSHAGQSLEAMTDQLAVAWDRWDRAHRRLIGERRAG